MISFGGARRLFNVGRGFVLAVSLVVGGAMVAGGCSGPDHQALCEAREQCRGGNDKDVEACVAAQDLEEEVADIIGCTSEYEDYTDCFIEQATCKQEVQGAPCTTNEECTNSGFAACANGFCTSNTFGLPDGTACEKEDNTYRSCT